MTRSSRRRTWTEVPQWILIAAMFAAAALSWGDAPDRIPVHWNLAGEADRYGGKFEGLLGVPLIAVAVYLLLRFLPRIDPGRASYALFSGVYRTIRLAVTSMMAVVYGVIQLWIHGSEVDVGAVIGLGTGALFVLFGGLMGKIRPNWFFGIRTPWTLSSKTAWVRTHRLGGWLFIALGLDLMAAGVTRSAALLVALGALLVGGMLALAVYSYRVWRSDPEKVPPTGTSPAEEEPALKPRAQ